MTLPELAADPVARLVHERLTLAAGAAVEAARASGFDLDDPRGAGHALASLADPTHDLPLPAHGQTAARLAGLAAVASVDVTLGRLFEAHTDALAILAELRGPAPEAGQRWGVWAAEGPESTLTARPAGAGFVLDGMKPWCSGASFCTHALVTAAAGDAEGGRALYAVPLDPPGATAVTGSWQAVGLAGSSTEQVRFTSAPAVRIGEPGEYLARAGFWHGAIGVAAAWWGGSAGVAAPLYAAGTRADAHALAHLGAVEVSLSGAAALLREAAATMDAHPSAAGQRLAYTVRAAAENTAAEVIDRVGRALGPAPLCRDRTHARRVADLMVYVRQSHAERDLAQLGTLVGRPPAGRVEH
jgi:hypothetical protein